MLHTRRGLGSSVALTLTAALALSGCPATEEPPPPVPGQVRLPSAAHVLDDPRAALQSDFFAVDDHGNLLQGVLVPDGGTTEWCGATSSSALVWNAPDGRRRAWSGDVMARMVEPVVGGGFAVGSVLRGCSGDATGAGADSDPDPYLVDAAGRAVGIRWLPRGVEAARARRTCGARPDRPRCAFSPGDGTGWLLEGPFPRWFHRSTVQREGEYFVHHDGVAGRTVSWSLDGRAWRQRRLPPDGELVFGGAWLLVLSGRDVEYSDDRGRTWHSARLDRRVERPVVTTSGVLLAGWRRHGEPDRIVRSAEAPWTSFEETGIEGRPPLWLMSGGDAVLVQAWRTGRWWASEDSGLTWRRLRPLGR